MEIHEPAPTALASSPAASRAWTAFAQAVNWDLPATEDWHRFLRFAAEARREGVHLDSDDLRALVRAEAGERAEWLLGLLTEAYRIASGPT
jgi:hypothetical protein